MSSGICNILTRLFCSLILRYKESLPQTVADIFERMEFNGYVEGVSEFQAAPGSTHAPADLVSLEAHEVFSTH